MDILLTIIPSAIAIATIFLFGCVGETVMEKAGHLNLGIPGVMCFGCFGGCLGVSWMMSAYSNNPEATPYFLLMLVAILTSIAFSMIAGLIYALLTVTLKCNQNVTGLALTTFGAGFADYFMNVISKNNFAVASKIIKSKLPFGTTTGGFGLLFFNYSFLVYFGIIVAVITFFVLRKTGIGLSLRAVGENPGTADAAGINVTKYKYFSILGGSAIAGLGGLYYVMDSIGGSWSNSMTLQAFGWLSIALVIFSIWNPLIAILGSFLFGLLYILPNFITGISSFQSKLLDIIPYAVTVIVLIFTSIFGKKNVQPPEALGLAYFREER